MKLFTGYVAQTRSGDYCVTIVQPTVTQCLGCKRVIILGFPANWGRYIYYAVLPADAVATGEVNCYFDSAKFQTLHCGSARASLHGKQPWLARMGEPQCVIFGKHQDGAIGGSPSGPSSVWVPLIDRVPNDRPFHKCNKFGDLVLNVTVLT